MVVGDLSQTTQLVVIGAGPGGYVASIRAAQLGQEVTLIEKDLLGGICLNWGCIPSKAMIEVAGLKHQLSKASEMGLVAKGVSLDMAKLHEWKNGIVEKLRKGIDRLLSKNGIDVIQGKATFTEPGKLSVESREGLQRFDYEKAILATGSRPIELSGIPFDNEVVIDSSKTLSLEKVPDRFLVIGAGSVGIEMGMVYGKLGSQVTIIEALDKLLPMIEPEISLVLERSLSKSGISLKLASMVKKIVKKDSFTEVTYTEAGQEKTMEADKVLVAVGRRPNTENIGLDKLGLSTDPKGFIEVNEKMETEAKGVYAIGDIVEGPMLAHRASHMGKVAAEVIAGLPAAFDNLAIPGVIFSDPEIATAGLTEREAIEKGYKVKVGLFPFRALGRAMTLGEVEGTTKVISDGEKGTVLGIHIIGPHASDLISEGALAVESSSHLDDISLTIHPHPTLPEGIAEAAEAVEHKAIHIYNPPKKK